MEKSCKNCEFNLRGKCTGHGNVYEYEETIVDDSKLCDDWSASLEYFTYQTNHCPIHIAKQLSSVDHLFWTNGMALDAYTEDEIAFIHYLQKTSGKHTPVVRLEYFLDIGARPHMSISTLEKN